MYVVSIAAIKLVQSHIIYMVDREEQHLERKQGSSQQKDSTSHPLCCCGLSCQDSILIFTHLTDLQPIPTDALVVKRLF